MQIRNQLNNINLDTLMGVYHDNYIKINHLIDFYQLENNFKLVSKSSPADIEIDLIESAKYTSTIMMNYLFTNTNEKISNAKIRVYHDARQVEVLTLQNKTKMASFFSLTCHDGISNIEARWYLNNFLQKWLQHCVKHKYIQC